VDTAADERQSRHCATCLLLLLLAAAAGIDDDVLCYWL
jgi:hypothetical protein